MHVESSIDIKIANDSGFSIGNGRSDNAGSSTRYITHFGGSACNPSSAAKMIPY